MNRFSKYIWIVSVVLAISLFFPALANAQSGPPDPCTDPFNPCPIDSGVYALLAIGVAYGIRMYKNTKNNPGNMEGSEVVK